MKNLILFSLMLVSSISFAQTQKSEGLLKKETLKERCLREGFPVQGKPSQEDLWLIELGKKGYSNEEAIKEVLRRKDSQQKISYSLKSPRELFEYRILNPRGKKQIVVS